MNTQKKTRILRLWLPLVMIAIWGRTASIAQVQDSVAASEAAPEFQSNSRIGVGSELRPNSLITLVKLDGKRIKGRLVSLDLEQSLLTMGLVSGIAGRQTYPISEVAKIEYREAGKMNPGLMVFGGAIGALLGGFIGQAMGPSDGWIDFSAVGGALNGGLLGVA